MVNRESIQLSPLAYAWLPPTEEPSWRLPDRFPALYVRMVGIATRPPVSSPTCTPSPLLICVARARRGPIDISPGVGPRSSTSSPATRRSIRTNCAKTSLLWWPHTTASPHLPLLRQEVRGWIQHSTHVLAFTDNLVGDRCVSSSLNTRTSSTSPSLARRGLLWRHGPRRLTAERAVAGRHLLPEDKLLDHQLTTGQGGVAETIQLTIGRPWTPSGFFQKALDIDHPCSQPAHLADMLARCVFKVITVGPKELKRQRAASSDNTGP